MLGSCHEPLGLSRRTVLRGAVTLPCLPVSLPHSTSCQVGYGQSLRGRLRGTIGHAQQPGRFPLLRVTPNPGSVALAIKCNADELSYLLHPHHLGFFLSSSPWPKQGCIYRTRGLLNLEHSPAWPAGPTLSGACHPTGHTVRTCTQLLVLGGSFLFQPSGSLETLEDIAVLSLVRGSWTS